MLRRLLVLIVLLGVIAPAAAGALSPDPDPTGTSTTTTTSDPTDDPERGPAMDPDGLSAPGPTEAFVAWVEQLVRNLVVWVL